MDLYRGEIFMSIVTAGKCNMDDKEQVNHLTECNPVPPKYGYNWWFSYPEIQTNFLNNKNTTNVFMISWLYFQWYLDNNLRLRGGNK